MRLYASKILLYIFRSTFFLCLFIGDVFAQEQQAVIEGQIENAVAYMYQGNFHQNAIKWYFDYAPEVQRELVEVPDQAGNFKLTLPLSRPMSLLCDYNGEQFCMFLAPGDNLKMRFNADNVLGSVQYEGTGASHNKYCLQLTRQYANEQASDKIRNKRYGTDKTVYLKQCESARLQEMSFFNNFVAQNKTSPAFQAWARAEAKYRYANHQLTWFFSSGDKQSDGYKDFVRQYSFDDLEALPSNQYLLFLDYHLRNLSMRDSEQLRTEREILRQPWVVRGIVLADSLYRGKIWDYAVGKLLLDLVSAEYGQTPVFYKRYMEKATDTYMRNIVEKRFAGLMAIQNIEPPAGADLFAIDEDYPLSIKGLLARYKGKVVYVDFWGTWCGPCLAEMPYSVSLQQRYAGKDIVFVYLATDDLDDKWRGVIGRYQITGQHYLMSKLLKADAFQYLNVKALPHYVLLDKMGNVVEADARKPSNARLTEDIDRLLAE